RAVCEHLYHIETVQVGEWADLDGLEATLFAGRGDLTDRDALREERFALARDGARGDHVVARHDRTRGGQILHQQPSRFPDLRLHHAGLPGCADLRTHFHFAIGDQAHERPV